MLWFLVIFLAIYTRTVDSSGPTFYIDFEHPNVTYWNPDYYSFLNFTARRLNRRDPIHYVSAHSNCLRDFGNEVLVEAWLYEFLSNEYRPSFLQIRYKLCELFQQETNFIPSVVNFSPIKTCPLPKGEYHFVNLYVPSMPILRTFPFTKGRLFVNVSNWKSGERVVEIYIDVVIKQKLQ